MEGNNALFALLIGAIFMASGRAMNSWRWWVMLALAVILSLARCNELDALKQSRIEIHIHGKEVIEYGNQKNRPKKST